VRTGQWSIAGQDKSSREVDVRPVYADGVPTVVVNTRVVTDEQSLSTAQVVSDLSEPATQTDRQVVTVWCHLVFTDPEQQAFTGPRTYVHLDVQSATTRPIQWNNY